MRNYSVNVDSMLNRLIPSYINGRKFHLFLKALFYPLQYVSDLFQEYATDTMIKANMTSQTIMLEWYLNYKLSKYFNNSSSQFVVGTYSFDRFRIASLYHDEYVKNHISLSPSLYPESQGKAKNPSLHIDSTRKNSFYVMTPYPNQNIIEIGEYVNMVKAIVNEYKLASKSFKIILT